MASVLNRSGGWYAKFKGVNGKPSRQRINAATRAEARRMADDLERQAERQRLGLDAVIPKNGGETVEALLQWWLDTYSAQTASHKIIELVVKRHLFSSELAHVPVGRLTAALVECFLIEKTAVLGEESLNRLRRILLTAFNRARECGRFPGLNPISAVKRRRVTRRTPDYLHAQEVQPLMAALDEKYVPLFATALYTGLRKGELMALQKQDVDLESRLLTVSRSWDRDTTKGGHVDRIPLAAEVLPFLRAAIRLSKSELVFPAEDGSMRSREFAVEAILRRAMARAGLTTGFTHVCRRKGCSHSEKAPDGALRLCPVDGRKLWPKAKVRPLRFHDLRHTTASLLMQAGANPAAVQRILRHRDVRITTDVYGHLAPAYLRAEVDRLTFEGVASLVPKLDEPKLLAASDSTRQGPYGVQEPSEALVSAATETKTSVTTGTSEAVSVRFERTTPAFGGHTPSGPAVTAGVQAVGFIPLRSAQTGNSVRRNPLNSTPQGPRRVQGFSTPLRVVDGGPEVLTVREVALVLKVCTATVYGLVERGALAHFRVSNSIRVRAADLARFMNDGSQRE